MAEVNSARVALGQNFGKELENGRVRSPSRQKRGSQIELLLFDLRFVLIFDLWKKDTPFPLNTNLTRAKHFSYINPCHNPVALVVF